MEAPGVAQEIPTVYVPRKLVVPSGLKTGAATVSFGAVCVLLVTALAFCVSVSGIRT